MRKEISQQGFTLMELIAVMAIIAIMSSVLAPNIVDSIDRAYASAEQQNLQTLADQLTLYITRYKRIPSAKNAAWVNAIAEVSSMTPHEIEYNERDFKRRIIYDPQFFTPVNTAFNGFVQNQGLSAEPHSPRAILVSDLSRNVPAVANTSAVFNAIWNQSSTSPLIESDKLKIKRLHLASQFHRVIFSNQANNQPFYQLEAGRATAVAASSHGVDGMTVRYVLDDTQIKLFDAPYPSGKLEQIVLLQSERSMRYQKEGSQWTWSKQ